MRIISQDGRFDLPYELVVVSIDTVDKMTIIAYAVNSDDSEIWELAEYSTKEKAVKAMEMLRTECGNFTETSSINGNYFAFDYPKLFRFPQDSEV
jgi:hypothetical protein